MTQPLHKFLVALLCCPLLPAAAVAQNGYLENDPIWTCGMHCNWGIAHCFDRDNYNLFLCGDTLIADTLYSKLCQHGRRETYWYYSPPPSPDCQVGWYFYEEVAGLLREEGKQLYFRTSWQEDTLLYDFDLEIGDTLPSTYLHNGAIQPMVVSQVDSILIGQDWRKRFLLDEGLETYLIEGVGSSNGLLSPVGWSWACSNGLDCFGLGDTAYYPTTGPGCDLHLGVGPRSTPIERLTIRPNPTSDVLLVDIPRSTERLVLVDAFGRMVRTASGPFLPNASLNVAGISPGTYFLIAEGGQRMLGKAVVLIQ